MADVLFCCGPVVYIGKILFLPNGGSGFESRPVHAETIRLFRVAYNKKMAGIRHVEIWVSDLKTSLIFYSDFLSIIGWKQVGENGISCGSIKIYFRERKDITHQAITLGPRHICFEAENDGDVDRVSTLPAIKRRILHGPGILHPGSYMFVFTDPDGSILEVAHKS